MTCSSGTTAVIPLYRLELLAPSLELRLLVLLRLLIHLVLLERSRLRPSLSQKPRHQLDHLPNNQLDHHPNSLLHPFLSRLLS
jgi:hypothetical protein